MKIYLVLPPKNFVSGADIYNEKTIDIINNNFKDLKELTQCNFYLASTYYLRLQPYKIIFKIARLVNSYYNIFKFYNMNNSILWLVPNSGLESKVNIFKRIKQNNNFIVYHIYDNWMNDRKNREKLLARSKYIDILAVSTEEIKNQIKKEIPYLNVEVFEEPIDGNRFTINQNLKEKNIVWTGSYNNLKKYISEIKLIMERLTADYPTIKLKIISGKSEPKIIKNINYIEWAAFDEKKEDKNLNNSIIGLSILQNTVYDKCKGNYKVKTYLSKGLPVVGTDWGYNKTLIQNNLNGFLCRNTDEYVTAIKYIINNSSDFQASAIQEKVQNLYSHELLVNQWLGIIRKYLKK